VTLLQCFLIRNTHLNANGCGVIPTNAIYI
jgi:hypothetical protein